MVLQHLIHNKKARPVNFEKDQLWSKKLLIQLFRYWRSLKKITFSTPDYYIYYFTTNYYDLVNSVAKHAGLYLKYKP